VNSASTVSLWLFVINLGVAFGAGIYEHRIVVPRWTGVATGSGAHWNPEAARQDDTGRRFWALVSTLPLTLLTLLNLYLAVHAPEPLRSWWLLAALCALADRLFTFTYFIPTMIGLMGSTESPQSIASAARWANLNYARHALTLAAWLAALKTFAAFYQQHE
jgi:MFS family permease